MSNKSVFLLAAACLSIGPVDAGTRSITLQPDTSETSCVAFNTLWIKNDAERPSMSGIKQMNSSFQLFTESEITDADTMTWYLDGENISGMSDVPGLKIYTGDFSAPQRHGYITRFEIGYSIAESIDYGDHTIRLDANFRDTSFSVSWNFRYYETFYTQCHAVLRVDSVFKGTPAQFSVVQSRPLDTTVFQSVAMPYDAAELVKTYRGEFGVVLGRVRAG
jgi:hypothetical protein